MSAKLVEMSIANDDTHPTWHALWAPERASQIEVEQEASHGPPLHYTAPGLFAKIGNVLWDDQQKIKGKWLWSNGAETAVVQPPIYVDVAPDGYSVSLNEGLTWGAKISEAQLIEDLKSTGVTWNAAPSTAAQDISNASTGVASGATATEAGEDHGSDLLALGIVGLAAWMFFGAMKAPRRRTA